MLIILTGGSGVGKTTLEKRLVEDKICRPLHIFTNRHLRATDPSWIHYASDIEALDTSLHFPIRGVNGKEYRISLPFNTKDTFITSIIEYEKCVNLSKMHMGKTIIVKLYATKDIVLEDINGDRNFSKKEINDRLKQSALENDNNIDGLLVDRDEAYDVILSLIQ